MVDALPADVDLFASAVSVLANAVIPTSIESANVASAAPVAVASAAVRVLSPADTLAVASAWVSTVNSVASTINGTWL